MMSVPMRAIPLWRSRLFSKSSRAPFTCLLQSKAEILHSKSVLSHHLGLLIARHTETELSVAHVRFVLHTEHLKRVCMRAGASCLKGHARPAEGAAAHPAGPPRAAARSGLPCPGSCCRSCRRQLILSQSAACSTRIRAHTTFPHAQPSRDCLIAPQAQLWH